MSGLRRPLEESGLPQVLALTPRALRACNPKP